MQLSQTFMSALTLDRDKNLPSNLPGAHHKKNRARNPMVGKPLEFVILVALVVLLWFAWRVTSLSVIVTVDGQSEIVRTHRTTVGAMLSDVGLGLHENERVSTALTDPLARNMELVVERARPMRILADGRDLLIASWGKTPKEALVDAGVAVDHYDQVLLDGEVLGLDQELPNRTVTHPSRTFDRGHFWQYTAEEPLQLRIYRSVPIGIDDGTLPYTIRTTAQTVGEALRQAQITLYLGDEVVPSLGSPVDTGLQIFIDRSTPVSLKVDGRYIKTRTQAASVSDTLTDLEIGLSGLDIVHPPLETELYENIEIGITRVHEDIEIEEDIVPFETVFVPDRNFLIDTQQVVNPGAEGITRRRERVRYENEQEVARVLEDTWIAQEPAQRVIAYGQKIEPNSITTPDGQQITYWRRIRMLATSYSAGTAGVPTTASYYGLTYTGEVMRKGIVAVDPQVIPLRSKVYVPNYGYGDALDTGSAIIARHIDLGFDDDNLELWNSWNDVYLLWPPPPEYQITWVLPNWPPVPR